MPREIKKNVYLLKAADWNRRLFDSLIPLPDGTSYNAYLVAGSEKTALLDTVDPSMEGVLMRQLAGVKRIDYLVSQHAEQDHSGSIPAVLGRYADAVVVCTPKAKQMLVDHLDLRPERIRTVEDGESISLGDKTLRFLHTPWVHWPETMSTYLPEDRILFSCDFFGSHLATSDLYAGDDPRVADAAKRYYAEIMMPFRAAIRADMKKVRVRAEDAGLVAEAEPDHHPDGGDEEQQQPRPRRDGERGAGRTTTHPRRPSLRSRSRPAWSGSRSAPAPASCRAARG